LLQESYFVVPVPGLVGLPEGDGLIVPGEVVAPPVLPPTPVPVPPDVLPVPLVLLPELAPER
jgi:hypothetical protein